MGSTGSILCAGIGHGAPVVCLPWLLVALPSACGAFLCTPSIPTQEGGIFAKTSQKHTFQTVTGASQRSLGAGKAYSCFWRQTESTVILLPIPSILEFQQRFQEEGLASAVTLFRAFQGESSPRHSKACSKACSKAHPVWRSTIRHL